jgi:hypothetical protein
MSSHRIPWRTTPQSRCSSFLSLPIPASQMSRNLGRVSGALQHTWMRRLRESVDSSHSHSTFQRSSCRREERKIFIYTYVVLVSNHKGAVGAVSTGFHVSKWLSICLILSSDHSAWLWYRQAFILFLQLRIHRSVSSCHRPKLHHTDLGILMLLRRI